MQCQCIIRFPKGDRGSGKRLRICGLLLLLSGIPKNIVKGFGGERLFGALSQLRKCGDRKRWG